MPIEPNQVVEQVLGRRAVHFLKPEAALICMSALDAHDRGVGPPAFHDFAHAPQRVVQCVHGRVAPHRQPVHISLGSKVHDIRSGSEVIEVIRARLAEVPALNARCQIAAVAQDLVVQPGPTEVRESTPDIFVRVCREIRDAEHVPNHDEWCPRIPDSAYLRQVRGKASPPFGDRLAPVFPLRQILVAGSGCDQIASTIVFEEAVEVGRQLEVASLGGQMLVCVHRRNAAELFHEFAKENVGRLPCHSAPPPMQCPLSVPLHPRDGRPISSTVPPWSASTSPKHGSVIPFVPTAGQGAAPSPDRNAPVSLIGYMKRKPCTPAHPARG